MLFKNSSQSVCMEEEKSQQLSDEYSDIWV